MMSTQTEQSQRLARALNLLVARSAELSADEIISELDRIEDEHAPHAGSDALQLETRRRIAEWKFKLLSERDSPFAEVTLLYDAVRALGFTNLETEGTIEIYFAQYCMRQSRAEQARRHLQSLCSKLDAAVAVDNLPGYKQLKTDAEDLLSQLGK